MKTKIGIFFGIIVGLILWIKYQNKDLHFFSKIHKIASKYPINNWIDSSDRIIPTEQYSFNYTLDLENTDSIYFYQDLPNPIKIKRFFTKNSLKIYSLKYDFYGITEASLYNDNPACLFIFFKANKKKILISHEPFNGVKIGTGDPLKLYNGKTYLIVGTNYKKRFSKINEIYF